MRGAGGSLLDSMTEAAAGCLRQDSVSMMCGGGYVEPAVLGSRFPRLTVNRGPSPRGQATLVGASGSSLNAVFVRVSRQL